MLEKESKFWPVSSDSLSKLLSRHGTLLLSGILRNSYFSFPFAPDDSLFRVRCIAGVPIIGAKGPRQPGAAKIREEQECVAESEAGAIEFMKRLGGTLHERAEERFRREWRMSDGTLICIDRLADLRVPDYCEIEALTTDAIEKWDAILGLTSGGANTGSCTFEELAAQFGVTFEEIRAPLPESVRPEESFWNDAPPLPVVDGDVVKVLRFQLTGQSGIIESGRSWARVEFADFRLVVDDGEALAGLLRLIGAEMFLEDK
ncbi:MAG: hypothetical protein Kow00107_00460 [Planctomycetota bacterium]